jgi:hypothetical protein
LLLCGGRGERLPVEPEGGEMKALGELLRECFNYVENAHYDKGYAPDECEGCEECALLADLQEALERHDDVP